MVGKKLISLCVLTYSLPDRLWAVFIYWGEDFSDPKYVTVYCSSLTISFGDMIFLVKVNSVPETATPVQTIVLSPEYECLMGDLDSYFEIKQSVL